MKKCSKCKVQSSNDNGVGFADATIEHCTLHFELCNLPPVSDMMRAAGLEPKKALGQNFLFDLNLTGKIARSVPDIENTDVVEVGPGPGGLTRALLMAGAARVIAIEKDKTTAPILEQIKSVSDGRLEIVYGDALKIENGKLKIENEQYAICSNLPYNIGTELLIRWLHIIAESQTAGLSPRRRPGLKPQISSMTLMFQREVAERIVAKVGGEQYGRLSVLTSLIADAKILFNVPRTAFTPAPKVESAVVQILPKKKQTANIENIEKLTARLFGQRRKMIRGIIPGVDWAAFGLTGMERAEELNPEKFAEIACGIML
ncbi:MAG: 16S rRNA (adenine(1518)-N(6)/adenine(1519)-N(6))-dimethyltransferase RsmA [Alphaproteobacteria bacterium]|nr:16S rRNA (adenine(1518)-N(6)/adenine(1519)-N(6))-dimethyltransferase RsmA [Alphaproteobacteria bacterium]